MEAEKKLLMPQNEHGAYLIRDSESRRNDYSLSVRDGDTVKHYRIRPLDEGGFFIARRTTFRTLQELVDHYSRDADGLCVNLRKPCVQEVIFYNLVGTHKMSCYNIRCKLNILSILNNEYSFYTIRRINLVRRTWPTRHEINGK